MSKMHVIKWLLVEWENVRRELSQYCVVSVDSLVEPSRELHTGKLVFVASGAGEVYRAKVVMSSDDRRFLEHQLLLMEEHSRLHTEQAATMPASPIATAALTPAPLSLQESSSTPDRDSNSRSTSEASYENHKMRRRNRQINQLTINGSKVIEYKHVQSSSRSSGVRTRYKPVKSEHHKRAHYNLHPQVSSTPFLKSEVAYYDQYSQTDLGCSDLGTDTLHVIEEKVSRLEGLLYQMEDKYSALEALIDSWSARVESSRDVVIEQPVNGSVLRDQNINNISIDCDQNPPHIAIQETPRNVIDISPMSSTMEVTENEYAEFSDADMVPIGSGKTVVPKHLINQMNWQSYTMATRKLLMAVFPRRTLATHSLTGKSSPAFLHKPAKLCLDPVKVNDIVMMVTDRCKVKESLVRSAITTKCADENKMFRMRQKKTERRQKNQENIPPTEMSDLESSPS